LTTFKVCRVIPCSSATIGGLLVNIDHRTAAQLATALVCALGLGINCRAQVVNITTPTTINAADTTIGTPPVPLSSAQLVVQGTTLTINRTTPITIASLELRVNGGIGATLTHTAGTRIDITASGNVSIDANSVITADSKGMTGGQGPGTGQTANGFNGGGAGYGGAGGDAGGSSQSLTTISGLGGNCYAFDQTNLFGPTALGSGGGCAWVNGVQDLTSGGLGGGVIKFQVGGTLTLNGVISARGGAGDWRGGATNRSGGGGSGGSVFISANAIAGTGSVVASGGNGGNFNSQTGGGGGGGRVAIITNSSNLDEITNPDVTGGTGSARGGAGTFYRRLGGESRGTLFIDGNNAAVGENAEFYGPLTLDANLVVQNNGRLGPANRLTDTDTNTFDLTILGNVTVGGGVSPGAINAEARGRRSDSGAGAGFSQEFFNGGGAGYGGQGGNGGGFPSSGGATYGDQFSMLLGSGGGSVWVNGVQDRTSGGLGGGVIKFQVGGTLTLNGVISARGGAGDWRGGATNRSGGGGSGGSIFISANAIAGTGSVVASGGNGGNFNSQTGGGGGGGRVVVVTCIPSTPTVVVAGGTGAAAGQAGTSVVRMAGVYQHPTNSKPCRSGAGTFQVGAFGIGAVTYQWRKGNLPIDTMLNPSAATSTLVIPNAGSSDEGSYDCVVTSSCGSSISNAATLSLCIADFDCSGAANLDDIFIFLNAWFAGCNGTQPGAPCLGRTCDVNGLNGVNLDDLFIFINVWFAGCAT
jgi:hypothetical protein